MPENETYRPNCESDSSELSPEENSLVEDARDRIMRGEPFDTDQLIPDLVPKTEPPTQGTELPLGIPKILHLVWVGPHDPPQEAIDSWEKKHVQGWRFILWRDHKQGWENQEQIDKRATRGEWNGVTDLMRYEILFKYGGVAVDADSVCEVAIDEGPEDLLGNTKAIACYENESVRPGMVGCGFLAAPPGSVFFGACIEYAALQDAKEPAWKTVGPMLMTRMAEQFPDDIGIYPARMFAPLHYSGTAAPGDAFIYARQLWGTTLGYNRTRKQSCRCEVCRHDRPFIYR